MVQYGTCQQLLHALKNNGQQGQVHRQQGQVDKSEACSTWITQEPGLDGCYLSTRSGRRSTRSGQQVWSSSNRSTVNKVRSTSLKHVARESHRSLHLTAATCQQGQVNGQQGQVNKSEACSTWIAQEPALDGCYLSAHVHSLCVAGLSPRHDE